MGIYLEKENTLQESTRKEEILSLKNIFQAVNNNEGRNILERKRLLRRELKKIIKGGKYYGITLKEIVELITWKRKIQTEEVLKENPIGTT